MNRVTIYDIKEHHIKNEQIRENLHNCYTMEQSMELRRARWLEKLAQMDTTRGPRALDNYYKHGSHKADQKTNHKPPQNTVWRKHSSSEIYPLE